MSDPMCQPIEKFTRAQETQPPVEPDVQIQTQSQPQTQGSLPPPPVYTPPSPLPPPVYTPPPSPVTTAQKSVLQTNSKTLYETLERETKYILSSFLCVYIAFSIHQDMYPVHTTRGILVRSAFAVALLFFIHRVLSMSHDFM